MAQHVPRGHHIKASFSEKGDFLPQTLRESHSCETCVPQWQLGDFSKFSP